VAFRRGDVVVALNTSANTLVLPADIADGREVVLASHGQQQSARSLAGDTAVWLAAAGAASA
jgi:hypothetical protein